MKVLRIDKLVADSILLSLVLLFCLSAKARAQIIVGDAFIETDLGSQVSIYQLTVSDPLRPQEKNVFHLPQEYSDYYVTGCVMEDMVYMLIGIEPSLKLVTLDLEMNAIIRVSEQFSLPSSILSFACDVQWNEIVVSLGSSEGTRIEFYSISPTNIQLTLRALYTPTDFRVETQLGPFPYDDATHTFYIAIPIGYTKGQTVGRVLVANLETSIVEEYSWATYRSTFAVPVAAFALPNTLLGINNSSPVSPDMQDGSALTFWHVPTGKFTQIGEEYETDNSDWPVGGVANSQFTRFYHFVRPGETRDTCLVAYNIASGMREASPAIELFSGELGTPFSWIGMVNTLQESLK